MPLHTLYGSEIREALTTAQRSDQPFFVTLKLIDRKRIHFLSLIIELASIIGR